MAARQISPHKAQQILLDSKARFKAGISGIQGGKTTIGAVWLLDVIYKNYEAGVVGDYLIAAPTVKILQQSTLVKFREFFPSDWGEWKEQRQCFELSWGGKIFVRSTDDPDHLEGMTILAAWLDEAGQMKTEAWINIQGRLSIARGPCMMTTTPYAFGWVNREILKNCKVHTLINEGGDVEVKQNADGDSDIEVVEWCSIANPAFPREEYERAKRTLTKEVFDKRYRGKFTRLEGLVYKHFNPDVHMVPAFPIPGHWRRFAGIDFGSSNPTAALAIAEAPGDVINDAEGKPTQLRQPSKYYVFSEFYKVKPLLREVAEWLQRHEFDYILGDPSAAQELDELRRNYGLRKIHSADNKIDIGIERVNTLFAENRLFFVQGRVPNTLDEILEYHHKPYNPDRPTDDKPVAAKNHAMDALKYGFSKQVQGMFNTNKRAFFKSKTINRIPRMEADSFTGYF